MWTPNARKSTPPWHSHRGCNAKYQANLRVYRLDILLLHVLCLKCTIIYHFQMKELPTFSGDCPPQTPTFLVCQTSKWYDAYEHTHAAKILATPMSRQNSTQNAPDPSSRNSPPKFLQRKKYSLAQFSPKCQLNDTAHELLDVTRCYIYKQV